MDRNGPGRSSVRPANKFSRNMNEEDKKTLREFLGKDAYSLCCGTVHLVKNDPKAQRQLIQQGIIAFVKDYAMKTYSLRLFDLSRRMQLWQETIGDDFYAHQLPEKENVLAFDGDACSYELNFSYIDEARAFKIRLDKYHDENRRRKNRPSPFVELDEVPSPTSKSPSGDRARRNNRKLSKADIGLPVNFKHLVHVGWKPDGLAAQTNAKEGDRLDPCVVKLLEQMKIRPNKLREEDKKMINEIIDSRGGLEQLKKEMEEKQKVVQCSGASAVVDDLEEDAEVPRCIQTQTYDRPSFDEETDEIQENFIPTVPRERPPRPPRNRDRNDIAPENVEPQMDELDLSEVEEIEGMTDEML